MENVLSYLERSVELYPDKCAVVGENYSYTYTQLNTVAKHIACGLKEKLMPNQGVILHMDKSPLCVAAIFGVLYAGGYYIPVDKKASAERVGVIQNVSKAELIIDDEYARKASETPIDEEWLWATRNSVTKEALVYTMFTSGSTGKPKGVMISHKAVITFIDCFTKTLGICEDNILANQAPFDFDVSVKDIYGAISVGATLVLVPGKYFSMPVKLMEYLRTNRCDTFIWAVAAMNVVAGFRALDICGLEVKKVIFSGEVIPKKTLDYWKDKLENCEYINVYGPTEITCNCTYHRLKDDTYPVPIGKAFDIHRVILVDGNKIVDSGDKGHIGEIYVSGDTLAKGYISDEEATKNKFFTLETTRETVYKTGDLAYYNEQGQLIYVGRTDNQVKHLGVRVELEEIEQLARASEDIKNVVCVEYNGELTLFYEGDIEPRWLKQHLKRCAENYMLPEHIVQEEQIHLTRTGKVDRAYYGKIIADT